jgi:ribonucleoside-diphosphate reductase alpha chain
LAVISPQAAIGLTRYFTVPGVHPYDTLDWHRRDARLVNAVDGEVVFEQTGIEFPESWSLNASNIVTQKYFRGDLGDSARERSLRQLIDRVVATITTWGTEGGYFVDAAEAETFEAELTHLLVTQKSSFNSPVWFNIGVPGAPPQASACFILAVDDTMESILNWYVEEGMIFRGGSGAGANLSRIRSSRESMSGGGAPSGPVSFMRGADASAGTIKSGGKTRRAAKMVILDADHPDVVEFIWCKALEERKARALREAGFDMDLDGIDSHSIQYQNANNSVRLSDEFMQAVAEDRQWALTARTTGETVESLPARDLFRQVAEAAWECADPGVQFESTINRWHTAPNAGPINASNPCSEYLHIDNSACNLSSLNLMAFLDQAGGFDVSGFQAAVQVMTTAQEILVGASHYPTEGIAKNARSFRQLGLGYANLGAMLMARGLPYDSHAGRSVAAAITAAMSGEAYATSARIASRMGAFEGFEADRQAMLEVLDMHRSAVDHIDAEHVPAELLAAASDSWDEACEQASQFGVRNAQVSVLAPTGTISFMMDCDTTGIEPDLSLVKTKKLVGGGSMSIVNQTLLPALQNLGYDAAETAEIVAHVEQHGSVAGAPHLRANDRDVFACSMGENPIAPDGHVKMMAAVQPFLSGGISKTVNLPEDTTVEEVERIFIEAWRTGVKAVAIYRDNCKVAQPLQVGGSAKASGSSGAGPDPATTPEVDPSPVRRRLPRSRASRTFEFRVADCKGFVTVGEYESGVPGEIFLRVSKQGSTLAGIMDAFAISVSHGLQYGVPLQAFVSAYVGMRFEPAGITDDPDIRIANSLIDYLFRRLALEYLSAEERSELGIFSTDERMQPTLPGVEEAATETSQGLDLAADPPSARKLDSHAPLCMHCGTQMTRSGSCYACSSCGSTSGCS